MNHYAPVPSFDVDAFMKTAAGFELKGLPSFLKWVLRGAGKKKPLTWGQRGSRWLGRQIHGTAGTLPGLSKLPKTRQAAVLRELGAGVYGGEAELAAARKAFAKAQTTASRRAVERAKANVAWSKMTKGTVAGTAKSMIAHPYKTLRLGWKGMDPMSKALFGGMGAMGAYDYMNPEEGTYGPEGMYENRGEHLGSEIGGNIGFIASGGLPFAPMMALSYGADKLLSIPGRIMGRG